MPPATALDTSPALTFRNLGLAVDPSRIATVKAKLQAQGISAWARQHGFKPKAVHDVLSGQRACIRGQSHAIALKLGLKDCKS